MKLKKENKAGIVGTLVFNVSFVVLLFLLGFKTPYPLPDEEGILIDFGYNQTGLGEIEPQVKEEQQKTEEIKEVSSEEEIITQNIDEAPTVIKKKTNKTEQKKEEEKEVEKEQRKIDPNVLFPNNNNSNNSNSQGINGGNGNQGDPKGGNTNNYNGSGQGNSGISYSLSGRNHKGLPKPSYTGNEEGKVVVEITVDRNGNVTSAIPGVKGTSATSTVLLKAAKEAALRTKFDKSESSPQIQTGSITYHFVLK